MAECRWLPLVSVVNEGSIGIAAIAALISNSLFSVSDISGDGAPCSHLACRRRTSNDASVSHEVYFNPNAPTHAASLHRSYPS